MFKYDAPGDGRHGAPSHQARVRFVDERRSISAHALSLSSSERVFLLNQRVLLHTTGPGSFGSAIVASTKLRMNTKALTNATTRFVDPSPCSSSAQHLYHFHQVYRLLFCPSSRAGRFCTLSTRRNYSQNASCRTATSSVERGLSLTCALPCY
jgi:hypothetical protein